MSEPSPEERAVLLDCTECRWSERVPRESERTASEILLEHARATGHQVVIDCPDSEDDVGS